MFLMVGMRLEQCLARQGTQSHPTFFQFGLDAPEGEEDPYSRVFIQSLIYDLEGPNKGPTDW